MGRRPQFDEDSDEAPAPPGRRPVPSLPPIPWLDRRLEFWDDAVVFGRHLRECAPRRRADG
jgi:hypothetical protein